MNGPVLCVDCGNTRLKWGLRQDGRWLAEGALPVAAADTLPAALPMRFVGVLACNVAGDRVRTQVEAAAAGADIVWLNAGAARCGVSSRYDNPLQLGADRWAALIGARALHAGPCLVVNSGTATTVDMLDAEGVFQGGLILPGLELMRTALAGNTAGLPLARGAFCELPRNTDDAIVSGALQATLGAVERMFAPLAGRADACCLLSGGAAGELEPRLRIPLRRVGNLVLEGLAVVAGDADG
ncbi:type III pantothenate kinase [Rhodocyclaceae bacterium]|nr:type III pantothenate kinase [Rhodocyclaceae bacterium]